MSISLGIPLGVASLKAYENVSNHYQFVYMKKEIDLKNFIWTHFVILKLA